VLGVRFNLLIKEEDGMFKHCRLPALFLLATAPVWSESRLDTMTPPLATHLGGYLVSANFTVDPERHTVISPPAEAGAGDLLSIRPLRLNADEYLVLQKCYSDDCSEAQVVRAWNAFGTMGPYPILSNKVPIEKGAKYLIWMQRIPTKGGESFPSFIRDSPARVFSPAGPARIFAAADLKGALAHGPLLVTNSAKEGLTFVAKFEGGSVVRMQMLGPDRRASAP
jgi:hypothetical protein